MRKELLAIITSVRHLHHYLCGRPFLIRTDHRALRWLLNFKDPEGQLARWLKMLGTYDLVIEYLALERRYTLQKTLHRLQVL